MERTTIQNQSRLGYRYYSDALHYRDSDLQAWLPELQALGASWLVLETPADRAIPEFFIRALLDAGITPLLQMGSASLVNPPNVRDLSVLLNAYANWGVKHLILFDRPNSMDSWGNSGWFQADLVARFLDRFIPLAQTTAQSGIQPIFPALEPGGSFWDTVFLRTALQGIKSSGHAELLENLGLAAVARPGNRPLNWGAGGPEKWPEAKPYDTPPGQQDHTGFHIFDWYNAISQEITGKHLPLFLVETGVQIDDHNDPARPPINLKQHTSQNLKIVQRLFEPGGVSGNVIAGCFPLLPQAGKSGSPNSFYQANGQQLPIVDEIKAYNTRRAAREEFSREKQTASGTNQFPKPIKHYLLLPHPKSGNPEFFMRVTRPFVKKYAPTVGYAIREAFYARKVTIVGGQQIFPENLKQELERAGCQVEQITGSGTDIATILAEL
jgi:hypothetical protein